MVPAPMRALLVPCCWSRSEFWTANAIWSCSSSRAVSLKDLSSSSSSRSEAPTRRASVASPGEAPVSLTPLAVLELALPSAVAAVAAAVAAAAPREKKLSIGRWCLLICSAVASASALLSSARRSLMRWLCSSAFSFASFFDFLGPEPCPPIMWTAAGQSGVGDEEEGRGEARKTGGRTTC